MATKLTQYIMSERFQEDVGRGIEKAIAQAKAAGLPPAGDQVLATPKKRRATIVYLPPRPSRKE
ncbi:hypothetical protein CMPELA_12550 [Cupriavidus necator]|uniref:Uncharacterized protein n=1 Tax=Cupriavidus necator (strain ATCC 17699 / DSM 428 / KCTC 22496 / NCIMB 10442 / H16 / Stanier 337) TaxID=381666 RepID=Q0K8V6_CUPNH|nr:hypothetical protein [Cupriavidus necator]QCC01362.1 hypothetical protein E6A55_12710 [Cupriavidus necator H16]QQB75810.1 hypothetical protein I6H87_13440 [Cupriavidus necator]WKA39748.1 hypothetical protein QWP09_12725 [Cupriavidus necator]CAJ93565.1 Hypothetical protein H16_A2477 [Cupriavidus necator H16]